MLTNKKISFKKRDQFISYPSIVFYVILFGMILGVGAVLKNAIGILSFTIFIYLLLLNKKDELILFLILWLYLYSFFVGQGWITNNLVAKYFIKGQLYVLIAFLFYFKEKWIQFELNKKLVIWASLFLSIAIVSDISHSTLNPNFVNEVYFIGLFLLILNIPHGKYFEKKVINLLIAMAILQVIISFLQVNQYISPPIKEMNTITGQKFLWVAGLDDVASGTFGAVASNVTSWFETIMMLIFFSYGILQRKIGIAILALLFLLQYTTVDSKTALGVTIIVVFFLLKKLKLLNFIRLKNFIVLLFIVIFTIIISMQLEDYYNKSFGQEIDRPLSLITKSSAIVWSNVLQWGKFAGFINISKDFIKYNPTNFLTGYGRDNFNIDDNSGRIESMDSPIMKLNNITRSRSSLIGIYGKLGLPGLMMLLILFKILWKDIKSRKYRTLFGKSFLYSGQSFLFGSLLFMFLYGGHTYRDQAFMTFFILYALTLRIEHKYSLKQMNS